MTSGDPVTFDSEEQRTIWRARYLNARRCVEGDGELARLLGIGPDEIEQWREGHAPDIDRKDLLIALAVVCELLTGFLEPTSIPKWITGHNAHLAGSRPIDILKKGNLSEVIEAIEAEKTGGYA